MAYWGVEIYSPFSIRNYILIVKRLYCIKISITIIKNKEFIFGMIKKAITVFHTNVMLM